MLKVSESACANLSKLLSDSGAPEGACVRFILEGEELSLTLDGEKPGDATFFHEGKTVLVMDEDVSQSLSNKTLDVEDSEDGLQLTIKD